MPQMSPHGIRTVYRYTRTCASRHYCDIVSERYDRIGSVMPSCKSYIYVPACLDEEPDRGRERGKGGREVCPHEVFNFFSHVDITTFKFYLIHTQSFHQYICMHAYIYIQLKYIIAFPLLHNLSVYVDVYRTNMTKKNPDRNIEMPGSWPNRWVWRSMLKVDKQGGILLLTVAMFISY